MRSKNKKLNILKLLLVAEIIYFVYAVAYYLNNKILPQPFFYDPSDTFMDYFYTMDWAWKDGRYDQWQSVYPMFVFILAKFSALSECIEKSVDAHALRECSKASISFLFIAYALGSYYASKAIIKDLDLVSNLKLEVMLYCLIAFSIPGAYALERGNYIVLAFLFLSVGAYYRTGWKFVLSTAFAVNVKQYLLVLLLAPLIKKRNSEILGVIFAGLVINVLSFGLLQDEHYLLLIENMFTFSTGDSFGVLEKIWNPTSLNVWVKVLQHSEDLQGILYSFEVNIGLTFLYAVNFATKAMVLIGFLAFISKKNRLLPINYIIFFLIISMLALTDTLGGYATLLLLPYLGAALMQANTWILAVSILFIFIPFEYGIGPSWVCDGFISFLSGAACKDGISVSLGSYVRPIAILSTLIIMTLKLLTNCSHVSEGDIDGGATR